MSERIVSRGDYDAKVEKMQSNVDRDLEMLQGDINAANKELARLMATGDYEAVNKFAEETTRRMDKLWKYTGHTFAISGHAHVPHFVMKIRAGAMDLKSSLKRVEFFRTGISDGFRVLGDVDDDGSVNARLSLAFYMDDVQKDTEVGVVGISPRIYAEPHEANFTYVKPPTAEVISSTLEDCLSNIDHLTKEFTDHIKDRQSEFYSLSIDEQQEFLRGYVDCVNSQLPDARAGDYLAMEDAISPSFYIADTLEGGSGGLLGSNSESRPSETTANINGIVMGYCVPDEIVNRGYVRYQSPEDFYSVDSGLCPIVRPYPGSNLFVPEDKRESDIIVPTSELASVGYRLV